MVSSLVALGVAVAGAILMALAFPKTNATVLAPLGAAAVFWAWFGLSPKRAFWIGLLAGSVFFSISFSWFGETAGRLIYPFGFFLTLGPAVGCAFFGFALVGLLIAYLAKACKPAIVPLAAAAAFALGEWVRSEGIGQLAVPFASLGLTQVDGPFAPLAPFVGSYGITFALCLVAAYAAYIVRAHADSESLRAAAIALGSVAIALGAAWTLRPYRTLPAATTPVAAIQGNIPQNVKFTPAFFTKTLERYTALTESAALSRPRLIVWPETVITAELNVPQETWLRDRLGALARRAHAELVVGTYELHAGQLFNALYFFRPDGNLQNVYLKRQLVPFAEHLPFAPLFAWIPWSRQVSNIGTGISDGVVDANGVRLAPIICWESAFTDLNVDDVRDGAQAFAIATDDAWFGTTAGPYQHAQIAQMRALETGRWIVRAAATGISGIVSPDGRYVKASPLDRVAVVEGTIGPPVATLYDSLGGNAIALGCALGIVGIGIWGRRRLAD